MVSYPTDAPQPSSGSSLSKSFRILRADFGDGYSQRVPDGLNTQIERWSMTWINLTKDERDTLVDFFDSLGGVSSFDMVAPGEAVSKKWLVEGEYTVTPESATNYQVSATLERVYDL